LLLDLLLVFDDVHLLVFDDVLTFKLLIINNLLLLSFFKKESLIAFDVLTDAII